MKRVEGYRGGRSKLLRTAKETSYRAQRNAFRDRKAKKRIFRSLWITRINAALTPYEMSYSQFMGALKRAKIELNRKMLSEMAIHDPNGFERLVEEARKNLPAHLAKAQ
jgi:large subunit ribosomal protein L20